MAQDQVILIPSPEACGILTATEIDIVKKALSDPAVTKYLRHLHFNALKDLGENDIRTEEEQKRTLSYFAKYKGIRQVIGALLTMGGNT